MPTITIPYQPRDAFRPFHARSHRWACLVVHRRGGKTVACINDLVRRCLTSTRQQPRYAYLAPYRSQAKAVAWDYLKRYTAPIPDASPNESELRVDLPHGGRITLYGSDNYDALRGVYLDGVILDEFADMDPAAWHEVIRPALSDRQGWATFIGTPKGRNEFFRLYDKARLDPEWYTMLLPASSSAIIPQAELSSARKVMGEQAYLREYECDFSAAVDNSIYGPQVSAARKEGRVRDFAADPTVPAFTFWDIGQSDFTVVWLVQMIGRDVCLLDAYCRSHEIPAHYAAKVRAWEDQYGVSVRQNYLPHDAEHLGPSGKTYVTYLKEAGIEHVRVVPRTPDVWLGINELRAMFARIYLHHGHLSIPWQRGDRQYPSALDCLELYQSKEQIQGGVINEHPLHDEHSHFCDGLRTMAEAYRLGLIEGTSLTAKDNRSQSPKVLRGVSDSPYGGSRRPIIVRR